MKLPFQLAAIMRVAGGNLTQGSMKEQALRPSQCAAGTSCCPSNTNCAGCCNNMNQVCLGGVCVNRGDGA